MVSYSGFERERMNGACLCVKRGRKEFM